MVTVGAPPTEWKTARWWQNRSTDERIAWAHVPKRWAHIEPTTTHPFITDFTPETAGLIISGPSGTGKTYTAVGLLKGLLTTHAVSGRFVNSDRYVEMLKDQFDNDNQLPEMYAMPHLVKYIKGVFDVVLLDGLGQERLTEFAQHELGSLLRQRYEDCRATVITTSLSRTDLIHRYGQRISGVVSDMKRMEMK